MARTYLEKFYFPLNASFIEGNYIKDDLTSEEIIEYLPFIQQEIDKMQDEQNLQVKMAEHLNGVVCTNKVMNASWGVTHRYGVPYGIVRVRCSEPINVYERNMIRIVIGMLNEDSEWTEFQYKEILCNDKKIQVRLYDDFDCKYFVHTQSLMYIKWKRKKQTKKWANAS